MIEVRDDAGDPQIDVAQLERVAQTLLGAVGKDGSELSIALVDDAEIRALNHRFRAKDRATDVLSFPSDEVAPGFLGDVVISVETARRQAAAYDAPLQNEIYRLLIHGLLHALGHDHHEPVERAVMEAQERRLAETIAMPWPYD